MNTAIGLAQVIERAGMNLGERGGVQVHQPVQTLDCLALLLDLSARLLLAYRVDGLVEGLDDVGMIDDERGVRARMLERLGVGAVHVAPGRAGSITLERTQILNNEPIDSFAAYSKPHPHHLTALAFVDQGGEFSPLAAGSLACSGAPEAPDVMSIAPDGDAAVQQSRERQARHVQKLPSRLLRHSHDAAEHADLPFEPAGDVRIASRRADLLLCPTMRRALDLSSAQPQ